MTQYSFGAGRKHRKAPRYNARDPQAIAQCDGCGFRVQHNHLREQKDYRGGSTPVGLGLWVCASCEDVPQPYFARQLLRPDPVPVRNPRPEYTPTSYVLTEDGLAVVITEQNDNAVNTEGGLSDGFGE